MSRKRENSVFRAIGLTRKQLCQMTIYEGICYAFFAALATLAVGLPIAVIAARKFSEMTFHGVIMPYSFPFLQMGLFVLVLFGLEAVSYTHLDVYKRQAEHYPRPGWRELLCGGRRICGGGRHFRFR